MRSYNDLSTRERDFFTLPGGDALLVVAVLEAIGGHC